MKLGKGTDFPEYPPAQSFLSHMCSPTGCWGGLQMGGGVGVGMEVEWSLRDAYKKENKIM